AKRLELSAKASLRRVLGMTSSTVSPGFHVRAISTYEFAGTAVFNTLPLTLTLNPSPAQNGRRSASGKFCDDGGVTLTVAVCPMGRSVATSSFTPADSHSAVEGAYRFTRSLSLPSL